MVWVAFHVCHWDLVGTEGILNGNAINLFWPGPAFGGTQDNGRPLWLSGKTIMTSLFLIGTNLRIAGVQCLGEGLVHAHGIIPLNKVDIVAMTCNEVINL